MSQVDQGSISLGAQSGPAARDLNPERETTQDLNVVSVNLLTHQEYHVSLRPLAGETPRATAHRLATELSSRDAAVVRHEVFASPGAHTELLHALRLEFGQLDWPVTCVECGEAICGMNVFAVSGVPVESLSLEGRLVGRVFGDGRAQHCVLGDLRVLRPGPSQEAQYVDTFEIIARALTQAGMTPANLVRTWFFLGDIGTGYQTFNSVRTRFFRDWRMLDGVLPASTGVGTRNSAGTSVVAGAWAIKAPPGTICIRASLSPLQCSPLKYGNAFSRAVLVESPGYRRLFISGTASIDPNGKSAHAGGPGKQIELAMKVVESILNANGMTFRNVTRATAYFKDLSREPFFRMGLTERNLGILGICALEGELCRRELEFEIELDAISSAKPDTPSRGRV